MSGTLAQRPGHDHEAPAKRPPGRTVPHDRRGERARSAAGGTASVEVQAGGSMSDGVLEALLAERHLLRSLLRRCEGVLQNVAIEARTAGELDVIVEELLRDISVATE